MSSEQPSFHPFISFTIHPIVFIFTSQMAWHLASLLDNHFHLPFVCTKLICIHDFNQATQQHLQQPSSHFHPLILSTRTLRTQNTHLECTARTNEVQQLHAIIEQSQPHHQIISTAHHNQSSPLFILTIFHLEWKQCGGNSLGLFAPNRIDNQKQHHNSSSCSFC